VSPYSTCGAASTIYTLNFAPNVAPIADFNYTVTPCAASFSVPVLSTSSPNGGGPITSYTWDWGDGTAFGTGASTVHTYGSIGTKTVELKVSNGSCTDSITKTFSFSVGPVASFTNSSGCLNTATTFSSTTTPTAGITAHLWDFGDGNGGTGANPSHIYTTAGPKIVTYTVVSASCNSTITQTINVFPNPVMAITANTVCLNVPTTFVNTSTVSAPATISTWAWDFENNGSVDNATQTPTNTYTTAGTFVAVLTATTNNGCINTTSVNVKVNPLPTATFTPGPACLNANVLLNNTSSIAAPDNITTSTWNFGAGANPATGTGTNVTPLVYTTAGVKNITLNLTSNNSCTATITQTVEVYAQPVANFSTTSVCQGTATAYTDLSTPTGSITGWAWDFTNNGSGDNFTNAPSNLFSPSGTYTTGLIVTDNHGCRDTIALPVNVWGHAIPDFTPNNVCFGTSSTFSNTTNTTTNANVGGTPTWGWNFGDGSAPNTLQDPTYTYTSTTITSYSVTLTATTTNGCVDNITKTVIVNVIPTATFTPVNACMNANVLLNNGSTVPLPDNISSYVWNFGTGAAPTTTSNVQNPPILTYSSSGVKTITLTITANTTCSASITQTVTVYPQPVANFSTTSVCQGTATAYTDMSTPTGSITAWAWDFTNNGTPDNATNAPTNIYPTSGTFTTGLIVTDNNTCKDTIKLAVDVWGHTIPNFTPDKVCFGTASVFTNLTDETTNPNVGSGTTYVWDFADTSPTTTIVNPTHTYTLGGNANATYSVILTATSLHNCVDVITKPVSVYAIPTASFTSDSVCLGSLSHLTDASAGNGNAINAYMWDYLSDGTVDVTGVANPNFVFPAFGNNNVSYTVSTSPVVGLVCSNMTNTIQVWVNPIPQPDFTFVNNCINAQPNTFNGSSSMIAIGTNTAFVWAYGDGAVSTPTSASTSTHTYAAAGVYNTTLTLTSNKGCQNTIVKAVEVYEKPKMLITNSTPCDQSAMTFSATQQANSGTVTNWYWDFNNSITSVEGTGQNTSFTFAGPGDYTIHLVSETNHGCRDTVEQFVYVNYLPQPDFTVNDPDGCPKHCVTFTDMTPAIPGPATLANWTWTLGDGSNPVSNTSNATVEHCYINNSSSQLAQYSVQLMVTTSAGCTVTVTKSNYITVFPKPIANYTANPNPSNVTEPLVFFTNQSIDYTKWWWMFGDGSPLDSINVDPEHFYSDATAQTYYSVLLVANQYGCLDTAYLPVEIGPEFTFYIPNAFTPTNDDGINDYFNGTGIGIEKYEMWVYDRWGERVFYTDDIKKGWDGRVQGKSKEGKQDVYTWKVKLTDVLGKKHDYVGHVTLLN
jgi:gliding motility-associated-like protein